jgi:hypothetical protein
VLAHGRWFSPGTPASFTTKTGRHDIAEILLKVALNTKNHNQIILVHSKRSRSVMLLVRHKSLAENGYNTVLNYTP